MIVQCLHEALTVPVDQSGEFILSCLKNNVQFDVQPSARVHHPNCEASVAPHFLSCANAQQLRRKKGNAWQYPQQQRENSSTTPAQTNRSTQNPRQMHMTKHSLTFFDSHQTLLVSAVSDGPLALWWTPRGQCHSVLHAQSHCRCADR